MRVTIEMDFRILLIVLYNYYFQFHACVLIFMDPSMIQGEMLEKLCALC